MRVDDKEYMQTLVELTALRGFVREAAALTKDGECPKCKQDSYKPNKACKGHKRNWVLENDDAVAQIHELIEEARGLTNPADALPFNMFDHMLVLQAIMSGRARWEWFTGSVGKSGELCFGGMRYSTELDEFSLPRLSNDTRNRLRKQMEAA